MKSVDGGGLLLVLGGLLGELRVASLFDIVFEAVPSDLIVQNFFNLVFGDIVHNDRG